MKIAYLCSSILPSRSANSVHVMRMCAAYAALGHDVVLYAPDRRMETEKDVHGIYAYYGVPDSFLIRFLPWPAIRFRSQWYGWNLRKALHGMRPDLIHSRFLSGSAWVGKSSGVAIFESHAPVDEDSRWQAILFRWLFRRRRVDGLVVVTDALARRTLADGSVASDSILVAPDGADSPPSDLKAFPYAGQGERLQAGYVGQLYRGKGMEVLEFLAPMAPQTDFHVIGGSASDIAYWKARIVSKNVVFHGFVPPSATAAYIAGLDVCLLPNQKVVGTFTSRIGGAGDIGAYTSPLKLFEYMSHGKAILASRLPVLEEVLDDSSAMFAHPEKPEEWRDALIQLADPSLRRRLGESARTAFLARYSWKARAENILAFAGGLT